MKPESYREPSKIRCENCKYIFLRKDWEEECEFYCTLNDVEKRPLCGSVFLNESHLVSGKPEAFIKNMDAWKAWSGPREVCAFGCCDEHSEGE